MAIDSMLDMSEKEDCVDIFGYVTLMRTCRPSMVQTEVFTCIVVFMFEFILVCKFKCILLYLKYIYVYFSM